MLDIHPGLLIAQVVTFLLGITILWFVAWKPLVGRMRSRRGELESSLRSIDQKAAQIEELKARYEAELASINVKAQEVLKEADQKAKDILEQAGSNAQEALQKLERQLGHEREKVLHELRRDFSGMVLAAVEKVLRRGVDAKVEENLYEDLLKELENSGKN